MCVCLEEREQKKFPTASSRSANLPVQATAGDPLAWRANLGLGSVRGRSEEAGPVRRKGVRCGKPRLAVTASVSRGRGWARAGSALVRPLRAHHPCCWGCAVRLLADATARIWASWPRYLNRFPPAEMWAPTNVCTATEMWTTKCCKGCWEQSLSIFSEMKDSVLWPGLIGKLNKIQNSEQNN